MGYQVETPSLVLNAQLSVQNRIAFIRSVGKAANVLTDEQRQTLVGTENTSDTNTNN